MAKRIALCFDGAWNDPSDNTNLRKTYRSILVTPEQIKWYDKGVGTERGNKIRGGLTGRGLAKNILQGYKYLVDHYVPEDEIFLFGFSRGAYTARSLVGLIRNIGLLHRENAPKDRFDENPVLMNGFFLYQRRDRDADTEEAKYFRKKYSIDNVEIKFLGVWDTVGALGIPSNDLDKVNPRYEFHDTRLSGIVSNAFHALSIDETRPEFIPTLWTSERESGQTVEQVWFAGVHSEVGGGKRPSLTDLPLRWMQDKALANGLALDPGRIVTVDEAGYLHAKVSNHFDPPWKHVTWNPRSWNPLSWNFYRLWAWKHKSRPHVRPIGGTPVECVHGLVDRKIKASESDYNPMNHGRVSTPVCQEGGG